MFECFLKFQHLPLIKKANDTNKIERRTHSKSIDSCNHRLLHCGHSVPVSQEVSTIALLEGLILHLFNVGSRWETQRLNFTLWYISGKIVLHLLCCSQEGKIWKTSAALTSKGFFTAGDDNSSDVAVWFERVQGLAHLLHQPITQSVESLGSVQLDETHILIPASLFHQNILILSTCVQRESTHTWTETFVHEQRLSAVFTDEDLRLFWTTTQNIGFAALLSKVWKYDGKSAGTLWLLLYDMLSVLLNTNW